METKSKHTPGPWHLVSYLDEHIRLGRNVLVGDDVEGAKHNITAANWTVALNVPNVADARLIASAPALREALALVVDSLQREIDAADANDHPAFQEYQRRCNKARAALEAAGGAL